MGAEGLWHCGFKKLIYKTIVNSPHLYFHLLSNTGNINFTRFLWGLGIIQKTLFLQCLSGTQMHSKSIIVTTGPILYALLLTFYKYLHSICLCSIFFKATCYSILLPHGLINRSQLLDICITFIFYYYKKIFNYFLNI